MTAPLTPADCDLRDSKFMPVYVQAMLNSGFNAMMDDAAWRAGVTLWLKAWHQVPAASLPDDDPELCALAGLGRDVAGWQGLRDRALRGWLRCDDGRLYHPLVAEAALEAWISRLLGQRFSAAGHSRRWGTAGDSVRIEARLAEAVPLLRALNPVAEALKKVDRRKMPVAWQGEGKGKGEGEDSPRETGAALIGFEAFRAAYPSGHGSASAGKAWDDAMADGHDPALILAGVHAAKARWRREKRQPRYIPEAGNWLDKRSWLNFVPEAVSPAGLWAGPPEIRAAVLAELGAFEGETFARSYLDPAEWRPPGTVVARTGVAAAKLGALSCLSSCSIVTRK